MKDFKSANGSASFPAGAGRSPAGGPDAQTGGNASHPPLGGTPTRRTRPPKFYRIGEVVEYSGVSRQTIHNYTIMGLICEVERTRGGHRLYDEGVFERLDRIEEMKARKKSLDEIREIFQKEANKVEKADKGREEGRLG